jgi:hypothetical protein
VETEFCMVMPNICGCSVWNILCAIVLGCSILSYFLDLCSFAILYGDTDEEKDYIVCEERAILAMTH